MCVEVSQQLREYESSQSKYKEPMKCALNFTWISDALFLQPRSLSNVQELHKLRMSDALERKAARDAEVQDIWLSCFA